MHFSPWVPGPSRRWRPRGGVSVFGRQFGLTCDSAGQAWLAATAQAFGPYVEGAYQNYIDPTLADWEHAYYGANLQRLVRIKRAVDPDDFFHFAQSIPVRLGRSGPKEQPA